MGGEDRFWSKVIKGPSRNDHLLWAGAVADDGYGRCTLEPRRPHRVRSLRSFHEEQGKSGSSPCFIAGGVGGRCHRRRMRRLFQLGI